MLAQTHDIAVDAGPRQATSARRRLCAATGTVKPIEELIRFVVAPDGSVVPDIKRRLPGRGIWITSTRQALQTAVARNAFARSFRRNVRAETDLVEKTERLLEQAALDALAMCRKAGRLATGFAQVEAALARERVTALLHASEAAAAGAQKLADALHHRADAERIRVFHAFTSAQLDLALGRSNVIHAALLAAPESETFVTRAARLERFRTGLLPAPSGCGEHDVYRSAKAETAD
jgi:predicted RNA-binding protein YlxR (DUF448 family)